MIFEITQTQNGYYKVDWSKYISGMDVTVEQFPKFLELVSKHFKSETVGLGGKSCVYNLSHQVFSQNVDWDVISLNVYRRFRDMHEYQILAIYYQTREEAENFSNDLEQLLIMKILKE